MMWLFYRDDIGEESCWRKGSMTGANAHRVQCGSFVGSIHRWSAPLWDRRSSFVVVGPEERRSKPLTSRKIKLRKLQKVELLGYNIWLGGVRSLSPPHLSVLFSPFPLCLSLPIDLHTPRILLDIQFNLWTKKKEANIIKMDTWAVVDQNEKHYVSSDVPRRM